MQSKSNVIVLCGNSKVLKAQHVIHSVPPCRRLVHILSFISAQSIFITSSNHIPWTANCCSWHLYDPISSLNLFLSFSNFYSYTVYLHIITVMDILSITATTTVFNEEAEITERGNKNKNIFLIDLSSGHFSIDLIKFLWVEFPLKSVPTTCTMWCIHFVTVTDK